MIQKPKEITEITCIIFRITGEGRVGVTFSDNRKILEDSDLNAFGGWGKLRDGRKE